MQAWKCLYCLERKNKAGEHSREERRAQLIETGEAAIAKFQEMVRNGHQTATRTAQIVRSLSQSSRKEKLLKS